jgi:hypothetical protein
MNQDFYSAHLCLLNFAFTTHKFSKYCKYYAHTDGNPYAWIFLGFELNVFCFVISESYQEAVWCGTFVAIRISFKTYRRATCNYTIV